MESVCASCWNMSIYIRRQRHTKRISLRIQIYSSVKQQASLIFTSNLTYCNFKKLKKLKKNQVGIYSLLFILWK